jgi:hypothetical protein
MFVALGAWPSKAEILQGCAVLGGVASKAEIVQGLGHNPVKWSSCRAMPDLGLWPRGMEIVRVCISSAAGLVGMARQSRDLAGLCRP